MARPNDEFQSPSTLPLPELNPLLNPLLGKNMGRWAEVYFTTPPERREEAVIELLRELEAENPASENMGSSVAVASSAAAEGFVDSCRERTKRCHACGRENPATHSFCGMCGIQLHDDPSLTRKIERRDSRQYEGAESGYGRSSLFESRSELASSPAFGSNELSLFQAGNVVRPDEEFINPPSRPYGFYLGAAAIVIAALGYFAWRGVKASSQAHPSEQQASAPQPTPSPTGVWPARQSGPAVPASETAPVADEPVGIRVETGSSQPLLAQPSKGHINKSQPDNAQTNQTDQASETATPRANPAPSNGAQELTIAQGYLNSRDSAAAAPWLWKAFGDHNSKAALLLSDLYLRGDGVSKNCDQARVLLDAAARKGLVQAGERLRHLDAFGCR